MILSSHPTSCSPEGFFITILAYLVNETARGNLVDGMQWLLGVYTNRFNHRHKESGHRFCLPTARTRCPTSSNWRTSSGRIRPVWSGARLSSTFAAPRAQAC